MYRIIFILLFIAPASQCFGQKNGEALIDSLIGCVPKTTNDTLKIRLYKRITDEYFFIDTDRALHYARTGLALSTKMKWERGLGVFNNYIARAYSDKGVYDSCMFYNKKALAIQQEMKDTINIASTLNNMGTAEQNMSSNYPDAIKYYLLSLKESEKLSDTYQAANTLDNISQIYSTQKNYRKALEYGFKALRLREKLTDTDRSNAARELGNSMANLAVIYYAQNDSATATSYYHKAIVLHEKAGNKEGLAKAYKNLAVVSKDLPKKVTYGLLSKKLWDEINPAHIEAIHNLGNLGVSYLESYKSGYLPENVSSRDKLSGLAEMHLKQAVTLSEKLGNVDFRTYFIGVLAELQAGKGDYKNAYLNFRIYQSAQDSLFSQESKNQIAGLEGAREIALRDKQIQINKLELETQRKQRLGMIGGIVLLTTIGALLYWQNRTRKRTNVQLLHLNSELDEANQVKARFFAILSHDLRSPVANLVSFLNLQKEAPDLMPAQIAAAHQKRIGDSAEALLETMESMLLWSKSQMQQFRPQARPVQVSELFGYLEKFFAGTSGVTFSFNNPDQLTVVTDEDYLKTIMQNLTSNAVKALKMTPEATIHWEARKENGEIILGIINNGPEVSEEQLHALYSEQTSIGIKTGLGLHLIRDLAKAISCRISVFSKSSETVFRLAFAETVTA